MKSNINLTALGNSGNTEKQYDNVITDEELEHMLLMASDYLDNCHIERESLKSTEQ